MCEHHAAYSCRSKCRSFAWLGLSLFYVLLFVVLRMQLRHAINMKHVRVLCVWWGILFCYKVILFKTGSHCVAQAGLELLVSSDPPALVFQSAETSGVYHCAWRSTYPKTGQQRSFVNVIYKLHYHNNLFSFFFFLSHGFSVLPWMSWNFLIDQVGLKPRDLPVSAFLSFLPAAAATGVWRRQRLSNARNTGGETHEQWVSHLSMWSCVW